MRGGRLEGRLVGIEGGRMLVLEGGIGRGGRLVGGFRGVGGRGVVVVVLLRL